MCTKPSGGGGHAERLRFVGVGDLAAGRQADQHFIRARLVLRKRPAASRARDTETAKGGGQQAADHHVAP
ncbi:hypothetical protein [Streptomyces sp. C3-3]|uniref:hypothetical protein n=1 Tax=Streptomyces sp. C3-3 TaxID=2824901 RepID=UPI001B37D841|nr:hypothetical protein [Streptomyces sp. C3-3]MBQ1118489.1 hypothetical protein [Streptomyces sp. C3-3]